MKYTVDKKKRPAYLQLYNQIREDIVGDILRYHDKLPSIRALAEETGVSTITVEHAYALLCDEGYVESRERSGFFVIFRNSDGFALPSTAPSHRAELSFSHHASPDFPFSVLAKTMTPAVSRSSRCTGYTPPRSVSMLSPPLASP